MVLRTNFASQSGAYFKLILVFGEPRLAEFNEFPSALETNCVLN